MDTSVSEHSRDAYIKPAGLARSQLAFSTSIESTTMQDTAACCSFVAKHLPAAAIWTRPRTLLCPTPSTRHNSWPRVSL